MIQPSGSNSMLSLKNFFKRFIYFWLCWWNRLPPIGTWTCVLGLEPSQNLAWDSNPAKTLLGTWTHVAGTHPPPPQARPQVKNLAWDSNPDKTLLGTRTHMGGMQNLPWLGFIGWVISYANEWEDYSNYFWGGVAIFRIWATTHFLAFSNALELSGHLWVCHCTCWVRIKV